MSPENEAYLWDRLPIAGEPITKFTREIIDEMLEKGMINHPAQAWATLNKWCKKDWYDYGTTLDMGWKYQKQKP